MAYLNKVFLMGNLTRDPELRYTPSGTAVAQLGLAINRRWRDRQTNEWREETTFVDVDIWERQAETAKEHLTKGRPVFIEGRLRLDQWQDKQTGQKRQRLKVVCERWQFLGVGGPREGETATDEQRSRREHVPPAAAPRNEGDADNLENLEDDSIPF